MFTPPTEWLRLGSLVLDWFSVGGALCLLNPVYMVVNRYSTVQYSTVQYSTVQYSTVQHSTTIAVCRSVMSQAVDQDEVGRINSVLALFGAVR